QQRIFKEHVFVCPRVVSGGVLRLACRALSYMRTVVARVRNGGIFCFSTYDYKACLMTKITSISVIVFLLFGATDVMGQERRRDIEGDVGLQIATAKPVANVFPVTWGFGLGPRWGFTTAERLWIKLNFGVTRGA